MWNAGYDKLILSLVVSLTISQTLAKVHLSALNSMNRIFQHEQPAGAQEVEIWAARNEVESFQVVVFAPEQSLRVSSVVLKELRSTETGDVIGAENIQLFREEYTFVKRSTPGTTLPPGLYPDILVPFINPVTGKGIEPRRRIKTIVDSNVRSTTTGADMFALPFEVYQGQNQPLWIDIHVPTDAQPGLYHGKIEVLADTGKAELPVKLTVWPITLPNKTAHTTQLGHSFSKLAEIYGIKSGSQRFRELELRYCKMACEHRVAPPVPRYMLPQVDRETGALQVTPEQHTLLTSFIAEHHLSRINIPRDPFVRLPKSTLREDYKTIKPEARNKALRYYREFFSYLKEHGWEQGAYVYIHDEPRTKENYEQVIAHGSMIREAAPGISLLTTDQPTPHKPDWPDMGEVINIWCPLWACINREAVDKAIAAGQEVWSYNALAQRAKPFSVNARTMSQYDPPYWHIDQPLLMYRIPTWVNHQYKITGLLYWGSMIFQQENPWYNAALIREQHFNGSGFLIYPGLPCGMDAPVASMRLKNLRDGLEDYEYLMLLEQRIGRSGVLKFVDQIAPNWWEFARDPAKILQVRQRVADAITTGTK